MKIREKIKLLRTAIVIKCKEINKFKIYIKSNEMKLNGVINSIGKVKTRIICDGNKQKSFNDEFPDLNNDLGYEDAPADDNEVENNIDHINSDNIAPTISENVHFLDNINEN